MTGDTEPRPGASEPHLPIHPFGLPSLEQGLRGVGLAGLALTLSRSARSTWRKGGIVALPLVVVLGAGAALAAWAAVIHLTGGERFDDHPFL